MTNLRRRRNRTNLSWNNNSTNNNSKNNIGYSVVVVVVDAIRTIRTVVIVIMMTVTTISTSNSGCRWLPLLQRYTPHILQCHAFSMVRHTFHHCSKNRNQKQYQQNYNHNPRSLSSVRTSLFSTAAATTTTYGARQQQPEKTVSELIDLGKQYFGSDDKFFNFTLDDWQYHAGGCIVSGYNVIVCTPTGSGKTVIGEMALHYSIQQNKHQNEQHRQKTNQQPDDTTSGPTTTGIYTTPLKALSNQKYIELVSVFGKSETGLITGDVTINKGAAVTVMTTEVYRNIAWRVSSTESATATESDTSSTTTSTISQNELYYNHNIVVVLDEFHYMGHVGRGGVWEESIITIPEYTQIIALSATLSNPQELRHWIESTTNRTTVLIYVSENYRPVPIRYLYATKDGLYPLFRNPQAGPGAPQGLLGYRRQQQQQQHEQVQYEEYHNNQQQRQRSTAAVTDSVDDAENENNNGGNDGYDSSKNSKSKGFGRLVRMTQNTDDDDIVVPSNKIPRGLQVNPALKNAAKLRMQRVTRELQKQQQRPNSRGGSSSRSRQKSSSWDDFDITTTAGRRNNNAFLSTKQIMKERERLLKKEMRRSVPALHIVMIRLYQKNLLPAIFFIFSRNGCNEAARSVCRYMMMGSNNNDRRRRGGDNDDDVSLDDMFDSMYPNDTPEQQRDSGRSRTSSFNNKNLEKSKLLNDSNGRSFRPSSNYIPENALLSSPPSKRFPFSNEDVDGDDDDDKSPRNYDKQSGTSPLSSENWDFYASVGLLDNYEQVEEVANRLLSFNRENSEIPLDDATIEQFLLGVGAHHAGMLPAHKAFVEILFRQQLMKVVFATETLAAGINMPAKTTVICSMAKPVGSSSGGSGSTVMNLLDTHNLLQMAGRAGRRGMDTDGTCVIVATPFENEDVAAKILIDPIKPITSQFSPSYSLCINLIDRGNGKLDIAQQLVSKSFATWQKRQNNNIRQHKNMKDSSDDDDNVNRGDKLESLMDENVQEYMTASYQAQFMELVLSMLQSMIAQRSSKIDVARYELIVDLFNDRDKLKASSKAYVALSRQLEIETATVLYLENDYRNMKQTVLLDDNTFNDDFIQEMIVEDERSILDQIATQRKRVVETEREVKKHPFSLIATLINQVMMNGYDADGNTDESSMKLRTALMLAREGKLEPSYDDDDIPKLVSLLALELSNYAKMFVSISTKTKLLKKTMGSDVDIDAVLQQQQRSIGDPEKLIMDADNLWNDFMAITRSLCVYGCLVPKNDTVAFFEKSSMGRDMDIMINDNTSFSVTQAGTNVGMLGLENSLWVLIALGGALDVLGASSRLDKFDVDRTDYVDDVAEFVNEKALRKAKPEQEAEILVSTLRSMSPSELAGYVSSIVSEDSRSSNVGLSVIEQFQQLTSLQQKATQNALFALERFVEIQKLYSVDESSRTANIDISTSEVVTAWTDGCSWNDAVKLSGSPPGDLVRTLSRALDALRQLGNLPYTPVRRNDISNNNIPRGIHPDIRRSCREAAKAINRYPLKDRFSLEGDDDDDDDEMDIYSEDTNDVGEQ